MPEILPNHVPSPRTLLAWDGAAYRPVTIDAAGNLQIDVLTSGLPAGAATAAAQALALAQLQTIAEIRDALQSVNTDALQVRGEDQLFSYLEPLGEYDATNAAAAGDNTLTVGPVPAGEVWVVTSAAAWNQNTVCSRIDIDVWDTVLARRIASKLTPVIRDEVYWQGQVYLEEDYEVRAEFRACVLNDDLRFHVLGYKMTKE